MTPPVIRTENLCQWYNPGKANEMKALDSVSIEVYEGEVTLIQGASGSGKTTLLSLIGCMSRPYSGSIYFGEKNVAKLTEEQLARVRRENFGFIFQQFQLLPGLTALENTILPLYPFSTSFAANKNDGREILRKFGLAGKDAVKVQNLSGGEQQRVAIARALVHDPQILFADEPTAHLDAQRTEEFVHLLQDIAREGRTIVVASHDPAIIQMPCVSRRYAMHNGMLGEVQGR